jgi:anaerobic ribonucleoside-triphosphate reductase
MTEIELAGAPEHIKNLTKKISDEHIEFLTITNEATQLAEYYIQENVVGETSRAEAFTLPLRL